MNGNADDLRMEMPNTLAGGLVAAGGIAGYAKAGSMPSLIGGLVGGGALIGAGALVSTRKFDLEGHVIGMAAGSVLGGGMLPRFMSTGKFMPAGLVAAVGIAMACASFQSHSWLLSANSLSALPIRSSLVAECTIHRRRRTATKYVGKMAR